jgi:hypothetical protein
VPWTIDHFKGERDLGDWRRTGQGRPEVRLRRKRAKVKNQM